MVRLKIHRIDALTAVGRTNWYALLAYLAFVTITTLGVEDVDFFDDGRQTELPLIGVSIPTFAFFVFAPVLGGALYANLHLHIRKVTEALGPPPLGPPPLIGGVPLEACIKPWLFSDFVLHQRRDGAIVGRPLDTFAWFATCTFLWAAGPFTLMLMWIRTWPAHSLWLSALCAVCFIGAVYAGVLSWNKMRADTGRRACSSVGASTAVIACLCLPIAWLTSANSKGIAEWKGAYEWVFSSTFRTDSWFARAADDPFYKRFAIWSLEVVADLASLDEADLSAATFSALPAEHADLNAARLRYRADYCARLGLDAIVCDRARSAAHDPPPHLALSRKKWCKERGYGGTLENKCDNFFERVDANFFFEWSAYRAAIIADLEKPNLQGRDLRRARLSRAKLYGVDLRGARLDGADLYKAKLELANLSDTRLDRAMLMNAHLEGAILYHASLKGAILRAAWLEGAELYGAKIGGADLSGARLAGASLANTGLEGASLNLAGMEGSDLFGAKLERADLTSANLRGSNLSGSILAGTEKLPMVLRFTNLSGAINRGGALRFVDLRSAIFSHSTDFRNSFGDATVLLPDTLEPPCQWATHWLSDADFFAQWRGWIEANPDYPNENILWTIIAPDQWRNVKPVPPPEGCMWK